MAHNELGYKYIFILILLILIITSPTYCSFQKRQAPAPADPVIDPKNPPPPPGPCKDCVERCCASYRPCMNVPNTNTTLCNDALKNCNIDCNAGGCNGITYYYNCNDPPGPEPTPSTPIGPPKNPPIPSIPIGPPKNPPTPSTPIGPPKNPPPPSTEPVIDPKNPPPPPGPCTDCVERCCAIYRPCVNVPNTNTTLCNDALKKCNIDCNAGGCKGMTYYYNCGSPKTASSSSSPSPVKTPIMTCSAPDDPKCFPPGIAPIVSTLTRGGVETPTPVPNNVKLTTIITTLTSYFAGYTTTNSLGSPTSILPSTLYIVKSVAITEPTGTAINTVASDSITILYNFNIYGLWGITLSLAVIITTFVFMISA